MTIAEARHIAQNYTSAMGEVLPGYKFGIGGQEEFTYQFYFDFIWLTLAGEIPVEPPFAGGARGLTVNKKDGRVQAITHSDHGSLVREEKTLEEMYNMLSSFKYGKKQLADIKAKFQLSSQELLQLSKLIQDTQITKEKTYGILKMLLDKLRSSH